MQDWMALGVSLHSGCILAVPCPMTAWPASASQLHAGQHIGSPCTALNPFLFAQSTDCAYSMPLQLYLVPLAGKAAKSEDEVKSWDTEFCKVDQGTLFELILVSHESL